MINRLTEAAMIHIRYAEYNTRHDAGFLYDIPQGQDFWLLLLTHTPAVFRTGEGLLEYPAKSTVLFKPGVPVYYRACADAYENDWIRFDTDDALVSAFPIQNIPFLLPDPEYCHRLFQLIAWKHSFPGQDNQRIIDQLMQLLFSELQEAALKCIRPGSLPPHYHDLLHLRKSIYNGPHLPWTVSRMAAQLHLSESYLQLVYRKTFGLSCMDDCIRARIRLAQDQLLYTDQPVAEVAELCGYQNVEHFCRQFKRHTGQSPRAYRRQSSL